MNVREYQALKRGEGYLDYEGKTLAVDGIRGPRTAWVQAMEGLARWRQTAVQRAVRHIGTREVRRNSAPDIDRWLDRCRVSPGQPWCAAFASWCLSVRGVELRHAGVRALASALMPTAEPMPGDLGWWPIGQVHGHCGIVVGEGPGGTLMLVEGNSGDAVRLRRRPAAGVHFCSLTRIPNIPSRMRITPIEGSER